VKTKKPYHINITLKAAFKRLKPLFNKKIFSYFLIFLNSICITIGTIYLIVAYENYQLELVWDIFGILILISLYANILLIYIDTIKLNKMIKLGNQINLFCYFMLVFMLISFLLMSGGNFIISISYNTSFVGFVLVIIGYFGDFLFGFLLSYLNIKYHSYGDLWNSKIKTLKQSKRVYIFKKILKITLGFLCILMFIFGIYLTYALIFAPLENFIAWLVGIFTFQFSIFFSFVFLLSTVILLKMINIRKRPKIYYCVGFIGLFLTSIFLIPFFSIPFTAIQAEKDFTKAFTFGIDYNKFIDPYSRQYFMKDQFSLPGYFLGIPSKECRIIQHIPFYVGEGIMLYYDVYLPKYGGSFLPGNNSVIIKIHGGGWTAGDKGSGNMLQVNKYLAAQGYIVFDIQYGLIKDEDNLFQRILPTPEYVKGYFTIENQIKHIGAFIKKLNSTEFSSYNLNLDAVFLMGGSAGGHLTIATALFFESGEYEQWFGNSINIKGIIPLYPGDPPALYTGGNIKLKYPELFYVNKTSPPCLIFQGKKDFCLLKSQIVKISYSAALNDDCCIIYLPYQGHGNDLYFPGHFNQFLIYYLERFLYLCIHDKII
jgi:hypothetical protein